MRVLQLVFCGWLIVINVSCKTASSPDSDLDYRISEEVLNEFGWFASALFNDEEVEICLIADSANLPGPVIAQSFELTKRTFDQVILMWNSTGRKTASKLSYRMGKKCKDSYFEQLNRINEHNTIYLFVGGDPFDQVFQTAYGLNSSGGYITNSKGAIATPQLNNSWDSATKNSTANILLPTYMYSNTPTIAKPSVWVRSLTHELFHMLGFKDVYVNENAGSGDLIGQLPGHDETKNVMSAGTHSMLIDNPMQYEEAVGLITVKDYLQQKENGVANPRLRCPSSFKDISIMGDDDTIMCVNAKSQFFSLQNNHTVDLKTNPSELIKTHGSIVFDCQPSFTRFFDTLEIRYTLISDIRLIASGRFSFFPSGEFVEISEDSLLDSSLLNNNFLLSMEELALGEANSIRYSFITTQSEGYNIRGKVLKKNEDTFDTVLGEARCSLK